MEVAQEAGSSEKKRKKNYNSDIKDLVSIYSLISSPLEKKQFDQKLKKLKADIIKSKDNEAIKTVLHWERTRGIIGPQDEELLNAIEQSELSNECICINTPRAAGLYAQVGEKYKYKKYFDEARGKHVYVIFVKRTIAPEEQIDRELGWKISQGFMPSIEDYAKERVVYKRVSLVESQFKKIFDIDGEDLDVI